MRFLRVSPKLQADFSGFFQIWVTDRIGLPHFRISDPLQPVLEPLEQGQSVVSERLSLTERDRIDHADTLFLIALDWDRVATSIFLNFF